MPPPTQQHYDAIACRPLLRLSFSRRRALLAYAGQQGAAWPPRHAHAFAAYICRPSMLFTLRRGHYFEHFPAFLRHFADDIFRFLAQAERR